MSRYIALFTLSGNIGQAAVSKNRMRLGVQLSKANQRKNKDIGR